MKTVKTDYPIGTTFSEWKKYPDDQRGKKVWSIRRYIQKPGEAKKHHRYPGEKYKDIRQNEKEIDNLVIILNGRLPENERAKERIKIEHAYITEQRLDEYCDYVNAHGTDKTNGPKARNYVKKFFINFYINKLALADPSKWHKYQLIWGKALLDDVDDIKWSDATPKPEHIMSNSQLSLWENKKRISFHTIKEIVYNANRFIKWLGANYPDVMDRFVAFEPIPLAKMQYLRANNETPSEKRKWRIPDDKMELIRNKLKGHKIEGAVNLLYLYGLRRREGLALLPMDIKGKGLVIERQLIGFDRYGKPVTKVPKRGKVRIVPHWSMSTDGDFAQKELYKFIKLQMKYKVTPDMLSKSWSKLMDEMGLPYRLHDLRRTRISKTFRRIDVSPDDIRIGAGHSSLETTMLYNIAEEIEEDDTWVPVDLDIDEND